MKLQDFARLFETTTGTLRVEVFITEEVMRTAKKAADRAGREIILEDAGDGACKGFT